MALTTSMQDYPTHAYQQPVLILDRSSLEVLSHNTAFDNLIDHSVGTGDRGALLASLKERTSKPLALGMTFFNLELPLPNIILLVMGEVRDHKVTLFIQEKFVANTPSHYLLTLLDELGAYVFCKDRDYQYTYANKCVADLFGCSVEDIIGKTDQSFFDEKTAYSIIKNSDSLVINEGKSIKREVTNYSKITKDNRAYLIIKKPIINNIGDVIGLLGIATDITHYKEKEKEIRLHEQKLNTVLDNVGAYIYIKDRDFKFSYTNKMTQDLFQKTASEIIGKTNTDLLGEEIGEHFQYLDEKLFQEETVVKGVECFPTEEKDHFYWTVKAPLYDEDGRLTSLIGLSTDITEQKELEHALEKTNKALEDKLAENTRLQQELLEQASLDPLTNLYNRRYFSDFAKKEISKAKRCESSIALLMIDADHFKRINDLFGHDVGDQVLIKLGSILQDKCRDSDIICRHGGEEFLVLMPGNNIQASLERADHIRSRYQQVIPEITLGEDFTISIGIAMWDREMNSLEDFICAADKALYHAKQSGRNRVEVYPVDSASILNQRFV